MTKRFKCALIYPFYKVSIKQTQDIPLGVCHIKAKLAEKGVGSKVIDLNFADNRIKRYFLSNIAALKLFVLGEDHAVKKLLLGLVIRYGLLHFDVVCFSIYSFEQFVISLALSKLLKEKEKTIVFGGSFCEEDTQLMQDFEFIDFIVKGTGELGIDSLIKILENTPEEFDVKNLIYRSQSNEIIDSVVKNDVHQMSLPDFDDLNLNNYRDTEGRLEVPYCIGIGCANRCHYCSSHRKSSPIYKDPEQIGKDLRQLRDRYNAGHFFLICNFFNISETYMQDVAKELVPLNITWATCVTYKNISPETLRLMKESGCVKLLIGLENGSQRLLTAMNKKVDLKSVRLLEHLKQLGINNRINIILDLPGETNADVLENMYFLEQHRDFIDDVHFILFQLNKGAYIFNHPEQFGVRLVQNKKDLFEKYLYVHPYVFNSDNRSRALSFEQYPFYDVIKPFMKRYQ